ncbi:hypothetical protein, partial [Pseudomonas aeruginosa]|uniref:hypothetical protein n=1 Tax=Pseudomonas aeruginosa TaxID=287 RepID=UPI00374949B9
MFDHTQHHKPTGQLVDEVRFFAFVLILQIDVETLSSGLIGEARPIAMQNSKLRKLSANTTANQ